MKSTNPQRFKMGRSVLKEMGVFSPKVHSMYADVIGGSPTMALRAPIHTAELSLRQSYNLDT